MSDQPDIVIPVRESAQAEQLRYALRSFAANLPHRRVWLVGYRPVWARNVGHIPTVQDGSKYRNTTVGVRAACEHPDVTERFLLCNDDFFVMEPQLFMPPLHRGRVVEVEEQCADRCGAAYLRGMRETRELLERLGHADPLSYELHVPLPVEKTGMLAALDLAAEAGLDVVHKRTLYGVTAGIGGQRIDDVKVMIRGPLFPKASPYLSTMPDSFRSGFVGRHIRDVFPQASPYERKGS